MSFEEYKKEIEERFCECEILEDTKDTTLKNAEKTGDRDAYKNMSWIFYWRAISGNHSGTMKCSSCGKEIFTGLATLSMTQKYGAKSMNTKPKGDISGSMHPRIKVSVVDAI